QHDRHDRGRAIHHHPADGERNGWAPGNAWLDIGRDLRYLRWPGLGRTGRSLAAVGRFVWLSARDLRAESFGPADFVSFCLATLFQCTAVDRVGIHWACRVRVLLLARAGK